ncbi:MAG: inositol monophosphatase family protein [Actinomycetota bacterium]
MATPAELAGLLGLAERAALAGGDAIVRGVAGRGSRSKGAGDYVTDTDRESERVIGELLTAETPDIPLVGEEAGGTPTDRYWLVDPLDGTTNYLHGFPIVGVSIALIQDGRPIVGWYMPLPR